MWIHELSGKAMQITADGTVVVLNEQDQRVLMEWFKKNRKEWFENG